MAKPTTMATETRIGRAADILAELRAELHDGQPTPERPANLRERIGQIKDAQAMLQSHYESQWRAAHAAAPRQLRLNANGSITVLTTAMGGGSSRTVQPSDEAHAGLAAELEANQAMDAKVAAVAFAVWGWSGPVRIDYYGDTAVVTNGGRKLQINLSELPE